MDAGWFAIWQGCCAQWDPLGEGREDCGPCPAPGCDADGRARRAGGRRTGAHCRSPRAAPARRVSWPRHSPRWRLFSICPCACTMFGHPSGGTPPRCRGQRRPGTMAQEAVVWWAFSLYGVLLCVAGVGSSSAAILQDVSESVSSQSNDEPPREVETARMSPCVCSCVPTATANLSCAQSPASCRKRYASPLDGGVKRPRPSAWLKDEHMQEIFQVGICTPPPPSPPLAPPCRVWRGSLSCLCSEEDGVRIHSFREFVWSRRTTRWRRRRAALSRMPSRAALRRRSRASTPRRTRRVSPSQTSHISVSGLELTLKRKTPAQKYYKSPFQPRTDFI